MRRIKLFFAVAAAVAVLLPVGAAPATAHDFDGFRFGHHHHDFFDHEEDIDIDQFSVGAFRCFAVFEEERRDVDLEDVFCFPPAGGAPIEVV